MNTKRNVALLIATLITFGSLVGGANGALLFTANGDDLNVNFTSPLTWTLDATSTSNPQNAVIWIPSLWSAPQTHFLTNTLPSFSIIVGGVGSSGANNAGTIDFGGVNRQGLFVANSAITTASSGDVVTIPVQQFTIPGFLATNSLPDQTATSVFLLDEDPFTILGTTSGTTVPEPSSALLMVLGSSCIVACRRRSV